MSTASFYKWRAKYGGMDASMISQMKALEDENRRLKLMHSDLGMQADLLKEALGKSDWAISAQGDGRQGCGASRGRHRTGVPGVQCRRDVQAPQLAHIRVRPRSELGCRAARRRGRQQVSGVAAIRNCLSMRGEECPGTDPVDRFSAERARRRAGSGWSASSRHWPERQCRRGRSASQCWTATPRSACPTQGPWDKSVRGNWGTSVLVRIVQVRSNLIVGSPQDGQ